MICCPATIQPFLSEAVTTIGYTGNKPTVSVAYLQTDGTFNVAGIMTLITVTPTQVIVDHGGPASGYVKLLTT